MGFLSVLAALSLLLAARVSYATTPKGDQVLKQYLERAEVDGIIDKAVASKLLHLASTMNIIAVSREEPEAVGPTQEDPQPSQQRNSVFMQVYGHLTVLNILYLSGAIVIIGAYTLFMTLAYEQCNHAVLSLIMGVQLLLFGYFGVVLWYSVEYAYAGGM